MFEVYESYQNIFSLLDFFSKRGFVLDIKDFKEVSPDPNYILTGGAGGELLKHFFSLHSEREITDEQANGFAPIFYAQIFSHLPDDFINSTDIKTLFESNSAFWELIELMFDYHTAIAPYLKKELDKLYNQHPELATNNRVQLRDLQALTFAYKPFTKKELEPFFESCRESKIAPKKYFEFTYSAVKAARQAVLKKVNQDKREKERTQRSKQQTFTQIQENGFDKLGKLKSSIIPSSSIFGLINWTLKAGKSGLGELPERITQQAKGKKEVTFTRNGQFREITQTTKKAQDTVIIEVDALLESRQNSPARKIFLYVLSQILQQALSNNDVIRDGVFIKYQDMVDKGMYSDRTAAKRGLERAFDILSSIKVKGYIMHGKKKLEQVKASVLFYDLEHKRSGATIIRINDTINWEYIIQQYAMLPDAYYELPPNAADLYYLIFNQARINIKKLIENDGKINISYKTIQNHLGLPTADTATNPTTQIKNPISNAIGAILDSTQDALYIEETTPAEYTNINEYLEKGYITAKINDDYLKEYAKKVKEWDKAKLEAKKRNQKNADIARQKAIQKQIEQENKNS